MKTLLYLATILSLVACSNNVPARWASLPYPKEHLSAVEDTTDEHGIYLEYKGLDREQLLQQIEAGLTASGYVKVGEAFEGAVVGYAKGEDKLAVKVDQSGEQLFLAVFDAEGKEPLLHGVVFGKYQLGETTSGEKAKEQLLNELEK
ncbi:hypothetical protein [Massilia sp. CF038]|uniref:hypothetical protein n=1 Tax=Massilia sp. CF038 TaxID=1881045 RepID=UPI0009148B19|nr:hypothetical protein [Massilia sp. CF038]SHH00633.1 hypothetical protein SAMN05428948_2287 [Massilia sp. CF038]